MPIVRPLVGAFGLVCGLTLSERLRCRELLHVDSGHQTGFITSVTFSGLPAYRTIVSTEQRGSWMGCEVFCKQPGAPVDAGFRLASGCVRIAHPLHSSGALACPNLLV